MKRRDGRRFSTQDVRDLQMWFNLAWFGKEFREGEVELATGERHRCEILWRRAATLRRATSIG